MKQFKQNYKKISNALYISGLLMCAGAWAAAGFNIENLSTTGTFEEKVYDGELSAQATLRIDTSYEDVQFKVSKDDRLHITYYENNTMFYSFEAEEDQFVMKKENNRKFYDSIMVLDFTEGSKDTILVEVPKTFHGSVEIDTSNGTIQIDDLGEVEHVMIDTSYGDVELNNLKVKTSLEVASTNGSITLKHLEVQENINAKTTYGRIDALDVTSNQSMEMDSSNDDVKLDQVNVKDSLSIDTSYGDIDIAGSSAGSTILDTSNGSIEVHDTFTTSTLDATTSYGAITFKELKADQISLIASNDDIEGTVIGKKSEYTVDSDVSSGNTTLLSSKGSTKKSIYVKTSYGDCNIEFIQE